MGCGSSREAGPPSAGQAASPPPTRARDQPPSIVPAAITSQTAITGASLSTTTSNNQQHLPSPRSLEPATPSSISSPRTSIQTGHRNRRSQRGPSLTEHYNVPLQAPTPWKSKDRLWTPSQIHKEREEFFETRVTGRREIWAALKQVTECIREGDLADAQGMLDAVGITMPSGKLEEGGYDESGVLYRIPEVIISDPTNLVRDEDDDDGGKTVVATDGLKKSIGDEEGKAEIDTPVVSAISEEKSDKGKGAIEADALKLKCRLSDRGGPDVFVLIGPSQPVSVLIQRLRNEAELETSAKIMIAYLGHILDEKKSLEEQGWVQGHVVQGLIGIVT